MGCLGGELLKRRVVTKQRVAYQRFAYERFEQVASCSRSELLYTRQKGSELTKETRESSYTIILNTSVKSRRKTFKDTRDGKVCGSRLSVEDTMRIINERTISDETMKEEMVYLECRDRTKEHDIILSKRNPINATTRRSPLHRPSSLTNLTPKIQSDDEAMDII
ncbi:hypothetical protein Tco_0731683 [Tanacetum coccineum]